MLTPETHAEFFKYGFIVMAFLSFATAFGAVIITGLGALGGNNNTINSGALHIFGGAIFGGVFLLVAYGFNTIDQNNKRKLATVKVRD